jgi:UDP-glucose 4-epimerase
MQDQRVLVTGGGGFIGSNLAEELVKENEVLILDDLSTGRMENIKELVEKANVKFIRGSITDLHFLQKSFSNIDYVFHLAAIPSVPESIKDPISSNNVNINGTLNVLIAARDNQIRKVVYASSCAVYGDATIMPIAETATLNPKSPYAVAKLAGEYYCSVFSRVYNLPTTSLRYFNVYGPRQNPNSEYAAVIPKFMSKILADRPPVIYGDGLQTRDFVFVKDVVRANILAAESRETEVFNIGSGVSMTITELSKTIMDILDKDLKPLHDGPREGEIMHSYADISKVKLLGYLPEYSLEDGLRELMGWFKTGLSEKFANI